MLDFDPQQQTQETMRDELAITAIGVDTCLIIIVIFT